MPYDPKLIKMTNEYESLIKVLIKKEIITNEELENEK